MSDYHIPVMLKEVLEYLDVKPGSWYVDCNLGGGGHTKGILDMGGKVIGIDLDPDSLREIIQKFDLSGQKLAGRNIFVSENLIAVQGNFANLEKILSEIASTPHLSPLPEGEEDQGRAIKVKGILYDLGVSSYQLETPERGFSFGKDAPLDMRMDTSIESATAADLINGLHEKELAELFWKLGEENFSKPIARKIVQERQKEKITTTDQLAKIILSVRKRSTHDRTHPATRIFQALRIAVNDELNSLKQSLPQAFEVLEPGGRLVVISFHSLEDRIVKEFMKEMDQSGKANILTKKPLEPKDEEVSENPRARSGKLRVLEKV